MALSEKLMILITGDASGAISEMKKLAGEAEKNLGKAGNDVGKFSQNATKIGAGMVAVGTGLLATAISAASTTTDLGREVMKLQRYTGMNAESASKLAYAAKMSGVGVDDLAVGIGKLSKTMANTPDKLTKFGVEAKASDGKLRGMSDVLGDVAEKFKTMGPGTASTAAALDLFGRSGANLLPFLLKGRDGIGELADEAEKMGLVLSQDNVDAVKKNIVAQRELSAAVNGAKVQIGNEMLPILTKFTELVTGIPGPVRDVIGPIVVLGGAVAITGGAFLIMAGQVQKAKIAYANMSTTSQMMGKVLGGIAGLATAGFTIWSIYTQKVDEARAASQELADQAIGTAVAAGIGAASDQVGKFGEEVKKYKEDASGFGGSFWFWDRGKAEGNRKTAEENQKSLQMMVDQANAVSAAVGIGADDALKWINTQREAGNVFPTVEAAIAAYTGKIDLNTLSTEEAATAQDGYANSIKQAADALRAATDPYFAVLNAQASMTKADADYQEVLKDGTKTQAERDAAYLETVKAHMGMQGSLLALAESMTKGQTDSAKFQTVMKLLKDTGLDPSSDAAKALMEKIMGVGYVALLTAQTVQDNPIDVRTKDEELKATIERFKTLRALMILTGNGGEGSSEFLRTHERNAAGEWVPKSASGGYLPAGRPTLVGELGPELFIPSSSGSVMTSLSTSHAMSNGAGGGVNIQHLSVALPNVTNGDQLVDELQRYIRRNGPLPLAVAS
jgi:hypothetical protein